MTEFELTVAVWGGVLIVWGVIVLQVYGWALRRRERGQTRRWCPACGYSYGGEGDLYRRVLGVDGCAIVHAGDCGAKPGRVKVAPPTHVMTAVDTLTRRAP